MTTSLLVFATSLFIAQAVDGSIAQYGIAGAVLGWLMFRVERRIEKMEDKVRDLCIAISMDIISRETTETKLKQDAIEMFDKLCLERDAKKKT